MEEWSGDAHGDQWVRFAWEKKAGRFDIRGG